MRFPNRRAFLKSSALAAGVLVTGGSPLRAQNTGVKAVDSTSRLNVAVCGVNGRGQAHIQSLKNSGRATITHIIDVDEQVGKKRCDQIEQWQGTRPEFLVDYRDALALDELDAVTFATPNHLHALQATEALLAGKHVYVEKPVSHNVWEGRQIVNAADKTGLMCQAGTQSRSSQSLQDAVAMVRDGAVGEIQYAVGTCYKPRWSIGKSTQPLQMPDDFDYDKWLGPAAEQTLYRPEQSSVGGRNPHYDWHWDWNTGNGDMGNQGIHQMDISRWFLGQMELSPGVRSIGGRVGYDDAGDTPNTQTVIHRYPAPLVFETRGLPRPKAETERGKWNSGAMDDYRGSKIGVIVQGSDGHVVIPSYTEARFYDAGGNQTEKLSVPGGGEANDRHFNNWLDAIAADDRSLLNGDILEGHLSSALCHTGGISHQIGDPATDTEIREAIAGDNELLVDSYDRMAEHLARNEVDLSRPTLTLGKDLTMDPEAERFTGEHADEANDLLKRDYREGFAVPEVAAS